MSRVGPMCRTLSHNFLYRHYSRVSNWDSVFLEVALRLPCQTSPPLSVACCNAYQTSQCPSWHRFSLVTLNVLVVSAIDRYPRPVYRDPGRGRELRDEDRKGWKGEGRKRTRMERDTRHDFVMLTIHRRRRRDSTVESRRVCVSCVY